jgi:hypothetical protein
MAETGAKIITNNGSVFDQYNLKLIYMNKENLEKLFSQYEKSFEKLDLKTIAGLYADNFISAGPKGTIAVGKEDFLAKAEQTAAFYRSIGQSSGRILSKKFIPFGNDYTMVTIHWGLTFKKTGDKVTEFDVSYLVQETGTDPKIILFISHEDEDAAMKKLGLVKQQAVG